MICDNITTAANGHLLFAGQDTAALAREYGTPLYLMDEDRIRRNCRTYTAAFRRHFGDRARPLYASKALSCKRIYEIMREEDMGVDVVSSGEIYTALQADFDLSRAYFHSNNKTDEDIRYAMDCGVGCFVADNAEEIRAIEDEAAARNIKQSVLLRLTPGIDPHTYEAIATGKVDSKFGSAIETGQAEEITAFTLRQPHIDLAGFHCHVGSQVFAEDVFERAAVIMLEFIAHVKAKYGCMARQLDLGGGYGVRYVESDPYLDVDAKVGQVAASIRETCARLELEIPEIHMEPGRSIVADAGMTLYTVGTVKRIPGYKNYVSVDGSMADHPRYALYGALYTCFLANKMNEAADFPCDVVGRCCESGDIIQRDVSLPASVGRGDLVAVCTTGAYHYSMASNYNRLPRPPIVMLRGGSEHYAAVRRESPEDLCRNDL
nr:diaminopimelate decarboxylase [uncultured Oscillibacter sp.]